MKIIIFYLLILTETHLGPAPAPYVTRTSSHSLYLSGPPKSRSDHHLGEIAVISLYDEYELLALPLPVIHSTLPYDHQLLPCTVLHTPTSWKLALFPTYSSPTSTPHNVQTLYDILDALYATNNPLPTPLAVLLLGDLNAYVAPNKKLSPLAPPPHATLAIPIPPTNP